MNDFNQLFPNNEYTIRKVWRKFFIVAVPYLKTNIKEKTSLHYLSPIENISENAKTNEDIELTGT